MPFIASIEHESKEYVEKEDDTWAGNYGYFLDDKEASCVIEFLKIWKKNYLKILMSRYPDAKFNTEKWIERDLLGDQPGSIGLKICVSGLNED